MKVIEHYVDEFSSYENVNPELIVCIRFGQGVNNCYRC